MYVCKPHWFIYYQNWSITALLFHSGIKSKKKCNLGKPKKNLKFFFIEATLVLKGCNFIAILALMQQFLIAIFFLFLALCVCFFYSSIILLGLSGFFHWKKKFSGTPPKLERNKPLGPNHFSWSRSFSSLLLLLIRTHKKISIMAFWRLFVVVYSNNISQFYDLFCH